MQEREKIDLGTLFPSSSKFKLSQVKDKEFKLKPCTPAIMMEIDKRFGSMENLLAYPDAKNISILALSLMEDEDKLFFSKRAVKTIDIYTGDEEMREIGGVDLFMSLISLSVTELYQVYGAILESIGLDKKEIDGIIKMYKDGINKIANKEIDQTVKKKKVTKKKKK